MSVLRLFKRRPNDTWTETLHRLRPEVLSLRVGRYGALVCSWIPRALLHLALTAWLWRLAADHVFKRLRPLWYRFNLFSFGPGPIGEAPLTLII